MKTFVYITILSIVLLSLTACKTVGPEYQRPEIEGIQSWKDKTPPPGPAEVIQAEWWTSFQDPYLNRLIGDAIEGNYDLKILMGRIKEAGAAFKEARAERGPELNLSSSGDFTNTKDEGDSSQYTLRSELSWELDIWGKQKRAALATKAGYQAREADYRAGYLKLVADLAQAYFQLRQKDKEVSLTENFYDENKHILTIYRNQFAEGIVPKDKVLRQEAQVKTLEQNHLELEREREILENRIATLMGKPPGEIKLPLDISSVDIQMMDVPVGLPSDLLNRRPDIIAAEYRVLEATNRIGEAQAARLPSISLTANGGYASDALNNLLSQWTFGIAPKINLPIFDSGRRKAKVEASEAQAETAVNTYLKTAMTAFEEVENSLVNLASRKRQKVVLEEKTKSLSQVRSQTRQKLEMGLISQLEILDLEQELFQSEKSLLIIDRQLLDDTVTLYKALGGGWPPDIVSNASPRPGTVKTGS